MIKMPCRIGITTNPAARKKQWESKCVGFSNWRLLGGPLDRKTAQEKESALARQYGCVAHPGGEGPNHGWYVYYFTYTRER